MNDGRRVKELGIREVKMVANLDTEVIEGLVVVPVSLDMQLHMIERLGNQRMCHNLLFRRMNLFVHLL